ncbi:MAG: 50S ribosomal protein L32 [Candidatus Pacebacteria bacterium]|nr:50S ribosomal protein L32 [Candidatus Paceibacterota bacterium]
MVVRMRSTRSHTRNRRAHHALKTRQFVACAKCGAENLPHMVCSNCGNYNGRVIIDVKAKLEKREKTRSKKEAATEENK